MNTIGRSLTSMCTISKGQSSLLQKNLTSSIIKQQSLLSTINNTSKFIIPTGSYIKRSFSSLTYSNKVSVFTNLSNNSISNSKRRHFHRIVPLLQQPSSSSTTINLNSKLRSFGKFVLRFTVYSTLVVAGYFTYSLYKELHPKEQEPQSPSFPNGSPRKTLIILGTGWGAVSLLQNLDTTLYNVIVVSPRNYFLFTPLLPSTPVGTVNLKSIVEPIRSITRRSKGEVVYYEAYATDIDPTNKTITIKSVSSDSQNNDVHTEEAVKTLNYDYLVMSIGATSTTFNIPGVTENAIFMKEVPDSERVRAKIISTIEKASFLAPDDPERAKLLNFLIIGGGPTGVEFAAELQDFIKQDLTKVNPKVAQDIKVSLIEGLPNILNMFDKKLVDYTQQFLINEGINLKLNTFVKRITPEAVYATCEGEDIEFPYGVLVWSTGNKPQKLTMDLMKKLDEQTERRGLLINNKLRLLGAEDSIFGIGDCTFHPGFIPTAQVAHQEGVYLASIFKKLHEIDQLKWRMEKVNCTNKDLLKTEMEKIESTIVDFKYNHLGTLAYIGSDKAIADLNIAGSKYILSGGNVVFWFWRSIYLSMCVSLRNRVLVTADWIRTSIFGRDSSV